MDSKDDSTDRSFLEKSLDFLDYGTRGLAGAVAALYAAPMTVRNFAEGHLMFVEDKDSYSYAENAGYGPGLLLGLCVDVALVNHIGEQAVNGDYAPAIACGLTNLCFGAIEGVRWAKNRLEEIS